MSKSTLQKEQYRLRNLNLNEMNLYLQKIQMRLDQLNAIAQNPDFKGRTLNNAGEAVADNDAVVLGQLNDEIDNLNLSISGILGMSFYRYFTFMGG